MNGFDPNVAINMPEQQGGGYWSRAMDALGGMGRDMKDHPEKTSIALDMLGKGFDPKNPFAGIGTALGKSGLAAKAETAGQERSTNMFQQLMKAMTAKDQPGPSSFSAALGKDGKGFDYDIKGIAGIDEPTKMPGTSTPGILTDEDFASRFGDGGGF